ASGDLNKLDRTPGGRQQTLLNLQGALTKSVNLEPFEKGFDDILYGGLGDDFIHGGAGDDAISGAEALPTSGAQLDGALFRISYEHPRNPGNLLGFEVRNPDEFALYDQYDPLRRIMLDSTGHLVKSPFPQGGAVDFLLNFDAATAIHDGNDVLFGDDGNDWI